MLMRLCEWMLSIIYLLFILLFFYVAPICYLVRPVKLLREAGARKVIGPPVRPKARHYADYRLRG